MANKRIIDQTTDTALSAGDMVIVDSSTEGTRKYDLGARLAEMGDLDDLETTYKSDLVGAINEVAQSGGGGGTGLTNDIKQALLQIAQKVAYIDEDGQDYYDDLYDALYPPANLVSISAVYTQSGTVYETDSLDSLKTDLVVTAHYDDSTSQTVTTYVLSGTLTEGTSTITVTYSGKTTTFTVIVTAETILYPLENGTHVFTDSNRQLIVSNGNHFEYTSGYTTSGNYVNLSNASDNDTWATQASNINNHETIYTIPANSTVRFAVKNIKGTPVGINSNIALALRSGSSSSVVTTGNQRPSGSADGMLTFDDIDLTFNVSSAIAVGCLFLYAEKEYTSLSADIELYVDDARWI